MHKKVPEKKNSIMRARWICIWTGIEKYKEKIDLLNLASFLPQISYHGSRTLDLSRTSYLYRHDK